MQFEVRALDSNQQELQTLTLDASSVADALTLARQQGLQPLSAQRVGAAGMAGVALHLPFTGAKPFPLLLFTQEMIALLEAGLSVVEAIDTLLEKEARPELRSVLTRIATSLKQGKGFSGALDEASNVFPSLYVGIVRAAERTGELARSLSRFALYRQRIDGLRSRVVSAMIYPGVLLTVGGAVALFLMLYVVPRFAAVYQSSGRDLPGLSALLLNIGQFIGTHKAALVVTLVVAAVATAAGWQWLQARGGTGALIARLPWFRGQAKVYELSRLYMTVGMLIDGGIPAVQALSMSTAMLTPILRRQVEAARHAVTEGESLATAFERHQLVTPVSLRFIQVGERSGSLGAMLERAAHYHDAELARFIERFSKLFEPLLMAAIGLVIGFIVILLYMPIFDLAGSFR